jgi:hypothetical protein
LWLVTWAATPWLGIWGYGLAELAALWSYYVVHVKSRERGLELDYSGMIVLLTATLVVLFLGPWLAPLAGAAIWVAYAASTLVLDAPLRKTLTDAFSSLKVWLTRVPRHE